MSDGVYELPLSDDHLVLLGRQARAAGAIELIARWLARALLTPRDVNASAARVRRLQYSHVVQIARDLASARADAMDDVTRYHFTNNVTSWLNEADQVMQQRNSYLHGYWLAPDDDSPFPGYWDRQKRRTEVDLPTLTRAVEVAEQTETGGVIMLGQSLEMLGCPTQNNVDTA